MLGGRYGMTESQAMHVPQRTEDLVAHVLRFWSGRHHRSVCLTPRWTRSYGRSRDGGEMTTSPTIPGACMNPAPPPPPPPPPLP